MIKRMMFMLTLAALIFGSLYAFKQSEASMNKKAMASFADPLETVATVTAIAAEWQTSLESIGSVKAAKGADLAFEVSGIVNDIRFESGEQVKEGQILLTLISDQDRGKLKALEATASLDGLNLKRDQEQFKIKAVSQATLDSDAATLQNAMALVAEQKAIVDQKTLQAPFSGQLGIRLVDLGQFVNAGTIIVTLQALDTIYIDFNLPQQMVRQIKPGQEVAALVDTFPGETFTGKVTAINPKIDNSSRNVQIRAKFNNPGLKLIPGMFANVSVQVGDPRNLITLPQTAITSNSYGDTVYIVENNVDRDALIAHQVFVTTGATRGNQVAIETGLKAGDTVVVAGQLKLHNGSKVQINNSILPFGNAAPEVANY